MKIIGITGGVGSGKSEVLNYLRREHNAVVCQADIVAKNLQKKGTICYRQIVDHFGKDILLKNGRIDRAKLAQIVFSDESELKILNKIVHPAVKKRILKYIRDERKKNTKIFVIEAALLLEEHYDELCDETWFVHTSDSVRRKRLRLSRGYSDDKIDSIFKAQKSIDEFLERCDKAIDNSGHFDATCFQIESLIKSFNIK